MILELQFNLPLVCRELKCQVRDAMVREMTSALLRKDILFSLHIVNHLIKALQYYCRNIHLCSMSLLTFAYLFIFR